MSSYLAGESSGFGPREPATINANNCDPPVHRLPPEILVEIVHHSIEPGTCLRDLIRLTLVCKRWNIIVEGAAVLWGNIDADEGPSAIRKALEMAKDTPLDITFNEATADIMREDFFKSIGERIAQWRSFAVALRFRHWRFVLEDLKNGEAPKLETLCLSGRRGLEGSGDAITLFGGRSGPPKLRDVTLAYIPINLASLQLSGLRSLTLERTRGISSTDIINIITGSPNIESIRLQRLEFLDAEAPSQQVFSRPASFGNPSIQLPSLLYLSLDDIPASFLSLLLSSIVVPQLQTFRVDCELEEPGDAQLLLAGLHHHTPIMARLVANAQIFEINVSFLACYHIIIGGLDITLLLDDLPCHHSQETLDWVFTHLGKPVEDIPFHLFLDDWEPELAHLEWLARRITPTKLTVYSHPYYGTDPEKIIPSLSRPTSSTPVTWLFPRVEIIKTNLVWENGNADIVEMIRSRHSAKDGKDGVAAPVPFREIWLSFGGKGSCKSSPLTLEFLQEVQRVANGADVYWEKEKLHRSM
ncbi:hypothetical protein M407DRAFT_24057 [Tulasnella calospora MUT 4182]|uniref:F-box domain-containing protein n=1 Tax=Tulasnella calospora MUT 4182 TaxID=1051891 RepID=A0A0C3Q9D2_9AGAM|nr:hypothetical protein M407DRAFT_24057 [Tulasnella calospora MUT 4182]